MTLFSALRLCFRQWRHGKYEGVYVHERRELKHTAQQVARKAALSMRRARIEPDGKAFAPRIFGSKEFYYWLIPVGVRSSDGSLIVTRLYQNGTVLLQDIPNGPSRLRRTQLRELIRMLEVRQKNL